MLKDNQQALQEHHHHHHYYHYYHHHNCSQDNKSCCCDDQSKKNCKICQSNYDLNSKLKRKTSIVANRRRKSISNSDSGSVSCCNSSTSDNNTGSDCSSGSCINISSGVNSSNSEIQQSISNIINNKKKIKMEELLNILEDSLTQLEMANQEISFKKSTYKSSKYLILSSTSSNSSRSSLFITSSISSASNSSLSSYENKNQNLKSIFQAIRFPKYVNFLFLSYKPRTHLTI